MSDETNVKDLALNGKFEEIEQRWNRKSMLKCLNYVAGKLDKMQVQGKESKKICTGFMKFAAERWNDEKEVRRKNGLLN